VTTRVVTFTGVTQLGKEAHMSKSQIGHFGSSI
jgi:hypothetical protein